MYLEAWGKLPWPIIIPGILVIFAALYFWPKISSKMSKGKAKPDIQSEGIVETTVVANPDGSVVAEPKKIKPVGKYPAYVWRDESGISWEKIPEKVGRLYTAETTMPHPGSCYFVIERKGELKPYDPRAVLLPGKGESPRDLFRLLHWPEVGAVYTNISTLWEKLNMLLAWAAVFGGILVLIVGIDKLAK